MKSKQIWKIGIAVVITLMIACIIFALLLRPRTMNTVRKAIEDALHQGVSQQRKQVKN